MVLHWDLSQSCETFRQKWTESYKKKDKLSDNTRWYIATSSLYYCLFWIVKFHFSSSILIFSLRNLCYSSLESLNFINFYLWQLLFYTNCSNINPKSFKYIFYPFFAIFSLRIKAKWKFLLIFWYQLRIENWCKLEIKKKIRFKNYELLQLVYISVGVLISGLWVSSCTKLF